MVEVKSLRTIIGKVKNAEIRQKYESEISIFERLTWNVLKCLRYVER